MIVKAFVSGQVARSIYEEDEKLFILHVEDTDAARDCTPYDYNLFFSSGAEIKVFEKISIEELRENLLKEKTCFDALHGAIGGMDKTLSEATRTLSIRRAENLVKEPEIFEFIKSRFFGNPVPAAADLKGALKLSKRNNLQDMGFVYGMLIDNKDVPDKILQIFKKTIFRLSLVEDLAKINNIFITAGLFARIFICIAEKNRKELNRLVRNYRIKTGMKNQETVISQILRKMSDELSGVYHLDKEESSFQGKFKQEENTQSFDITGLFKEFQLERAGKKYEKGGSREDRNIREKIESQIDRIVK
ncbi:MAG: hypothetical protein QG657_4865 [Acidobacteriota bacterium]|nr:hypothetical protein [Acidobacteriota bacterium]